MYISIGEPRGSAPQEPTHDTAQIDLYRSSGIRWPHPLYTYTHRLCTYPQNKAGLKRSLLTRPGSPGFNHGGDANARNGPHPFCDPRTRNRYIPPVARSQPQIGRCQLTRPAPAADQPHTLKKHMYLYRPQRTGPQQLRGRGQGPRKN